MISRLSGGAPGLRRRGAAAAPAPSLLLVLAAAAWLGGGVARGAESPITLDEAVRSAIEKNLDLRVETFNPAIAETGVRRAGGIYNTKIEALVDRIHRNVDLGPATDCVVRTQETDLGVSLDRLLPTGADVRLSYTTFGSTDSVGLPESRSWQQELSLTLSQPLLAGFGREVTERGITTASDAREASLMAWRTRAIAIGGDARTQYFALLKARDDLETRNASLALARRVHAENEARVKAGVLAEIELLDSELGVAQREKDLIEAEKTALDQSDRLRVLIQAPPEISPAPAETFPESSVAVTEEAATATALRARPELAQARIAVRTAEFQARVSRNLALPSLSLNAVAGVSGLDREIADAAGDVGEGTFPFWSLGLAFAYPLGNDAAEAALAAARLQARQAQAALRSLEESTALEVRSAVRDLESKRKQIEVAQKGVNLAEARLASYLKRQKLGLSTTKDLFQVEADVVAARVGLSTARADYQGAVTLLYRGTGELLEKHGIRIDDRSILDSARKELP